MHRECQLLMKIQGLGVFRVLRRRFCVECTYVRSCRRYSPSSSPRHRTNRAHPLSTLHPNACFNQSYIAAKQQHPKKYITYDTISHPPARDIKAPYFLHTRRHRHQGLLTRVDTTKKRPLKKLSSPRLYVPQSTPSCMICLRTCSSM